MVLRFQWVFLFTVLYKEWNFFSTNYSLSEMFSDLDISHAHVHKIQGILGMGSKEWNTSSFTHTHPD